MSRSQTTSQSPNQRVTSALNAAHLVLQYVGLHKVVAYCLAQKEVFTLEMAQKAIHPASDSSAQSASQS
jgi:hypothetical protein